MRRLVVLFLTVVCFQGANIFAQTEARKTSPIPTSKGVELEIPKHLKKKGGKLRIKNLNSGKEAILDLSDEEFVSSEVVRSLLDKEGDTLVPEFSLLDSIKKIKSRLPAPTDPSLGGYRISKSLIFDQPTWRTVGFRAQRLRTGIIKIEIDPKIRNVVISADEAARRRSFKEARGMRDLFEAGWKALNAKQYDVSLEAFERVIAKKELLDSSQRVQAHYGKGVSLFHQKGCGAIENDFKIADTDPKYFEDISYYRGLCFVEVDKLDDAEGLFTELIKRQSVLYAEPSRFYLGLVSEKKENWDNAETAYLDTIDFASDQRLVELAKERVEVVRRLRAEANYQRRYVNFVVSLGTGYDSNVIALPQGLSPTDYAVTNKASLSYLGLGALEIKVPFWGEKLDHRIRASGLLMHYGAADIAASYDIQSYDGAMNFSFLAGERDTMVVGGSYNSVYLGHISASTEYLVTAAGELRWQHFIGPLENPTADYDSAFKYSRFISKRDAATAASDSNAQSVLLSSRYSIRSHTPHVYGPGIEMEFRPATNGGTDNSYWSTNLLGKWDFPVGPESWALLMGQEAGYQFSSYYQSAASRKDQLLKYSLSFSRGWWDVMETRLQLGAQKSLSNVSTYSYWKYTANLMLNAAF